MYRHFANEQALRGAVMEHLEDDAGIELAGMGLDDVTDVAGRIARVVAGRARARRPPVDPTLHDASRRQHDALLAAVGAETPGWSDADRRLAAALLDVLWSVGSYEHLAVDWGLDRDEAIRGTAWVIDLVTAAVREGRAPGVIRGARGQPRAGRTPGRRPVRSSCSPSSRIGVPFTSTWRTPVGSSAVRRSASAGKSRTRRVGPGPTVSGSNTHTSAHVPSRR